jgi:hypothetical protein
MDDSSAGAPSGVGASKTMAAKFFAVLAAVHFLFSVWAAPL